MEYFENDKKVIINHTSKKFLITVLRESTKSGYAPIEVLLLGKPCAYIYIFFMLLVI